ncbi:MAG: biotin transporter BioY [Candidatus Marinimicrobia bacterium]|nr:biotin transporter BioY [Candidatus Neomarinimicrobiota bacterium]
MTHATYATVLRPEARVPARLYDLAMIAAGSVLVTLTAQVSVLLPFTPVPITGQTFGVLLVGALLGSVRGGLALLFYLAEGVAGLPVFAGGAAGPVYLLGPTGGYLLAFIPAAMLVGFLAERGWDRRFFTTFSAMIAGTAVIFAGGLAWLSVFAPEGQLLSMGLLPFLTGAAIKIVAAALILPLGWKLPWLDGR